MMHWLHSEDVPPDAIVAMIKEVESGSDRAAAILAASCVEDQLAFAIKCKLCPDDKALIRDMFQVRGPLGSFSAKISMGYLLGLLRQGDQERARHHQGDLEHVCSSRVRLSFRDAAHSRFVEQAFAQSTI